ncbi:MAG: lipopolysaccharide biosynthesis protein [Burkholderiaceae bacterium]
MTGIFIAQLVTVAAYPIITRLYGPESFAALVLFSAIASTPAAAASGRYDLAIVIAKDPLDRLRLLYLSLCICGGFSAFLAAALLLGRTPLVDLLNAEHLGNWLFVAPLALFLFAANAALRGFANGINNYSLISRTIGGQSVVVCTVSILLGGLGFEASGQILAFTLGLTFCFLVLSYSYRKELSAFVSEKNHGLLRLAVAYKRFPIFEALPSLLNGIQLAMPIFFLTKYYPESVVGFYALLSRVAGIPMTLVGQAVSLVHLRKSAELSDKQDEARRYIYRLTLVLFALICPVTIILMLFAPEIFGTAFGQRWREAGEFLTILMPSIALRFVVSSLSNAVSSTGNNHLGAAWKLFAFTITLAMYLKLAGTLDVRDMLFAMMLTDLISYSMYYLVIIYSVRNPRTTEK